MENNFLFRGPGRIHCSGWRLLIKCFRDKSSYRASGLKGKKDTIDLKTKQKQTYYINKKVFVHKLPKELCYEPEKNNATDTTIEDIKVSKGAKAKKNNNYD